MEMCYDGALVMPKNYAVVSEEEMTYVDGGGIPTWLGGMVIDGIITAITGGFAISGIYAMKKFLKQNSRKLVKNISKQIMKMMGSVSGIIIETAVNEVLTFASTSIGDAIAKIIDKLDGNYNGWIF